MEPIEAASYVLYSLFAGLWAGSVLFVTVAVVPAARSGTLNAAPLGSIAGRLAVVSRVSAFALLLTVGRMAVVRYTGSSLTGSTGGRLVLATLALWVVLVGAVEVATNRLTAGADRDKVREPARDARRFFLAASVAALGLLVVAGLFSADALGVL